MTVSQTAIYDGTEFADATKAIFALYNSMDQTTRVRLPPIVKAALLRYLKKVATTVAVRNSRAYPGGTSTSSLSSRSGSAVQSIHDSVKVTGGNDLISITGIIGGNFYLRTHEFGATIRARNAFAGIPGGPYLTVPLPAALNANGTPKHRSSREWTNTVIIHSRNNNWLICQVNGRELIPLYVLKSSVTIIPRLGMSLTLDQFVGDFLADVLKGVRQEFAGAGVAA